jgi:4-azaleucine resistance transporter AzlC
MTKSPYLQGFLVGLPFVITAAPFGLLFGVLARDAGLDLAAIMGMSFLVIAGASQFAALAQIQENAPAFFVVLTALAVNLRMAIYSASLAPHLGPAPAWKRAFAAYLLFDNTFAIAMKEFEERPDRPVNDKITWFLGCATPVTVIWVVTTVLGALLGRAIPASLALDFAVPVMFLAVIAPMLRTLPQLAAALTGIVASLALASLPYGTGLLVAAVLAMMAGAETERRLAQ